MEVPPLLDGAVKAPVQNTRLYKCGFTHFKNILKKNGKYKLERKYCAYQTCLYNILNPLKIQKMSLHFHRTEEEKFAGLNSPRVKKAPPCSPFALVVHAVEAVPLGVELRERIVNLGDLSGRRVQDDVRVALVDFGHTLAHPLQIFLDDLKEEKTQMTGGSIYVTWPTRKTSQKFNLNS